MSEHDVPEPDLLDALVGTWVGAGEGAYPTIEPFAYREVVTFVRPPGKPFLAYSQRTQDPETGAPMHAESGWLRRAGDGTLEFMIAQPTGIVEVLTGVIEGEAFDLRSDTVALAPTAKPVRAVRRRFTVMGDVLDYDLWMAFDVVPETHHLHARLQRQETP